jgi:RNA-directed DNA polymerase
VDKARPFCMAKRAVWEAYQRVKASQGAAGVDGQSIEELEQDLSNNLYQLWNRMSSGSYFPPPVLRVEIPKDGGAGTRPLGIPTVSDRIAQMVVKRYLEPILEEHFHESSYGDRPRRSAHDALSAARSRCWEYDWVLELDSRSLFDSIDWELMLRAVRHHTDCTWVLWYIERWLKAPVCMPEGTLMSRERGTPQGAVVSPILANLFLHDALDRWMTAHFPDIPFERYADDAIYHCHSEAQARSRKEALEARLAACKLELHPQKTKIVYCKDANRRGSYPEQAFDLLSLYVSAPKGEEPCGAAVHQFRAGSQRPSSQSDVPKGASLAVASSHRSRLGRYRAVGSACGTGVGPILREVLPVRASRGTAHAGSLPGALGATQVQATPGSQ